MDDVQKRTWAEIDLSRMEHNYRALRALADAVSATHLVATEPQSAQALAEALGQEVRTDTLYLIDRARSAGMLVEVLP